ncbi:MAG: carboxypeptidase-like regulatory domain-containing protein [Bacteroidota bacterium]
MPKKIQLIIPKPCHEDWDAMTPVEKGKFCGSCQKQVVDFSSMSDRQVAAFFKKPSTGSVCGRFMTDQLDRDIEIPRKRIPWLKYFFTIALPAFFVSLKTYGSKTQGQIIVRNDKTDTTRKNIYDDVKMMGMVLRPQSIKPFMGDTVVAPVENPVVKDKIPVCTEPVMGKPSVVSLRGEVVVIANNGRAPVNGIVVNVKGEPVPFATIETEKGEKMAAGEDGRFEINKNLFGKKRQLIISSVGYETRTIHPDEENYLTGELYVVLKANVILPEVVLPGNTGMVKGKYIFGSAIRNKIITNSQRTKVHLPETEDKTRIFPNPIAPGSSLFIEWKEPAAGYFNLQLVNASGQVVHQKELWIDVEARLLSIDLPVVAAGSYFLVLANKKTGRKFSEKLMVL